ncbi:MAG: T9SS type A sorting domain-containing protein [Prevotellaceae bacterium]|nr:T9SS type A sorting domain-containing protein [Prevotellaceae bacterium]
MKTNNYFANSKSRKTACLKQLCAGIICLFITANAGAQSLPVITNPPCITPIVGQGTVIDSETSGLLSLLDGTNTVYNLIDGDQSNYVRFLTVASVDLGGSPIISIRNVKQSYAAGLRVGFKINMNSGIVGSLIGGDGLIDIDLINQIINGLQNNFSVRTYLNNQLQETSAISVVGLNNVSADLQQMSFITTMPFDEVELVQTGVVSSLLSFVDVYYAFVEPASGCSNDCIEPVVEGSDLYPNVNLETGATFLFGTISNANTVITHDTTDYATATIIGAGTANFGVSSDTMIPVGSRVGFVVRSNLANILNGIILITTMHGESEQLDVSTGGALIGIDIGGDKQAISMVTTQPCNQINLVFGGLVGSYDVFYAFVYPDNDLDGVYNCADKCPGGNDYMDHNGNGIPDSCDIACSLNAGMDITLCSDTSEYDFGTLGLGSGLTWRILPESTPGASIDGNGNVTGMTSTGVYSIEVSSGTCTDTVNITRRDALINSPCNTPIVGNNVQIFTPTGGGCLLCLLDGTAGEINNVIDGNLNNYIQPVGLLDVLSSDPLIGVRNTAQIYPAGTRTGFVIAKDGSLLDVNVLQNLQIKTYLKGVLQETSSEDFSLLGTDVISGDGGKQRIGFVTTKPFDAVVLQQRDVASVSLFNSLDIYYAFQEPANGCSNGGSDNITSSDCTEPLLANNEHEATINYDHTGIVGVAEVACAIDSIGNLIDNDPDSYTTIRLGVGALMSASVSVKSSQTISADYQAGFIIANSDANLLDLSALSGLTITTYSANGNSHSYTVNSGLVNLNLLGDNTNKAYISFPATEAFNEIQLTVANTVTALSSIHVYSAFILKDSDGDGTPDCMDRCCLGPDYLVGDDGLPTSCSVDITADASCLSCPVHVSMGNGAGISPTKTYSLYKADEKIGDFQAKQLTFEADTSGFITYTLQSDSEFIKNIPIRIHPAAATWKTVPEDSVWKNVNNWAADINKGVDDFPIWCTDVTIPGDAQLYPVLIAGAERGDECRDITFKHGASVGKIHLLKYRHAYVEFNPVRNKWTMITAPLKYMYSADLAADISWTNALQPQVFSRLFSVAYGENNLPNPDGIMGTSVGDFSESFSNLEVNLTPALGFALWVDGSPEYPDTNFPTGTPYLFPRRDQFGNDVQYDTHYELSGRWVGEPFYLPRGVDISQEAEWTANSVPETNSRYRFIYEDSLNLDNELEFSLSSQESRTTILGNPFMSHLDFNQFYNDNSLAIHNYFRIWDGEAFYSYIPPGSDGSFGGLDGLATVDHPLTGSEAAYIPPMQSFFVDTQEGASSLKFTPLTSVTTAGVKVRSLTQQERPDVLRLRMEAGGKTNQAIVALVSGASSGYNTGEDVYKIFSPEKVPEIYTVANQIAIEINFVDITSETHWIPIGFNLVDTARVEVELDVIGADNMSEDVEVYIIDRQGNISYNAKTELPISFETHGVANLQGRFFLSIEKTGIERNGSMHRDNTETSESGGIDVYANNGNITVSSFDEISALTLYDLSGRIQYRLKESGKHFERISARNLQGTYILKVETAGKTKSYKIIL